MLCHKGSHRLAVPLQGGIDHLLVLLAQSQHEAGASEVLQSIEPRAAAEVADDGDDVRIAVQFEKAQM